MRTPRSWTRREALRQLSARSLLALGLWPGHLSASANAGTGRRFRFIVISELHHAYTLRQLGPVDAVTNRCCARVRGNHDR